MHSIYDLQEKYSQIYDKGLLINEAKPFGVISRLKRAFTPMSKVESQAQAYSQENINNWYNNFIQQLANSGKVAKQATNNDVTSYTSQAINANSNNSKTWNELSKNPTGTFSTFGSNSLGKTFAQIFFEVDDYNRIHKGETHETTSQPEPSEVKDSKQQKEHKPKKPTKAEREDAIRRETANSIIAALQSIPGININNANINQVTDVATAAVQQAAGLNTKKETNKTTRAKRRGSSVSTPNAPGTNLTTT